MEMKTIHLTLLHSAIELLFIINWHVIVFIVALLHVSTGPAVHSATDTAMPEHVTLIAS
jgi:hypothetical protein